ncbi:MAG: hypothetical protein ACOWYE_03160 [Desulfatiglandales bacterium]
MLKRWIYFALFIAALSISGCEKEGPAEKAGEKIDETIEEAGEKMEEAGDKIKEKTD